MISRRQLRLRVLDALDRRAKQFRSREELWPFRVPHEPLGLDEIIDEALGEDRRDFDPDVLRSRTVLRMEWDDSPGTGGGVWQAWAVALPSGVTLYCDSDPGETRVLASVKRGSSAEADRFFLELLAESAGGHFGIQMTGDAPDRVRTTIADREFLVDVFVDLFETMAPEDAIGRHGEDFRMDVEDWLAGVLVGPTPAKSRRARRRPRRLRDEEPSS